MFETNIRFVGGLLTAYAFTGDKVSSLLIQAMFLKSLSYRNFFGYKTEVFPFKTIPKI